MDRRLVLVKTPKGNLEVVGRTRLLPRDLSDLLLLIDGRSTLEDILDRVDPSRRDQTARGFERLEREEFFAYRELGFMVPPPAPAAVSTGRDASLDFTPAKADDAAIPVPVEDAIALPRPDARSSTGLNRLVTPDASQTPMLTDVVTAAPVPTEAARRRSYEAAWASATHPVDGADVAQATPGTQVTPGTLADPSMAALQGQPESPGVIELTDALVLRRTMKGEVEIVQSEGGITPEAWTVLKRIDGRTSLAMLRRQYRDGEGILLASIVDLIDGGYVEPRSGAPEAGEAEPSIPDPEAIRLMAQKKRDQAEADEVQRVIRERVARDRALERTRQNADAGPHEDTKRLEKLVASDGPSPDAPVGPPPLPAQIGQGRRSGGPSGSGKRRGERNGPAVDASAASVPMLRVAQSQSVPPLPDRSARQRRGEPEGAAQPPRPAAPSSARASLPAPPSVPPVRTKAKVGKGQAAASEPSRKPARGGAGGTPPESPRARRRGRGATKWIGFALAAGLAAVIAMHFAGRWLEPARYELIAQEALGHPVSIGAVRPVVMPRPALLFENVIIGGADQFHAKSVRGVLGPQGIRLVRLDVEGVSTSTAFWWSLTGLHESAGLGVDRLQFSDLAVRDPRWSFAGLEANAEFAQGRLRTLEITNAAQSVVAVLRPAGAQAMDIEFSSPDLRPFDAPFTLADFSARGRLTPAMLTLSGFDARLAGALLRGAGRLRIESDWVLDGEGEVRSFELGALAPGAFSEARGTGRFSFAMSGPGLEHVFSAPVVSGTVAFERGSLAGVDLGRALQDATGAAGATRFQKGDAAFRYANGRLLVTSLLLSGPNVSVSGSATLDAKQQLGGRVQANLRAPGRDLSGVFSVGGTLAKPAYRRGG